MSCTWVLAVMMSALRPHPPTLDVVSVVDTGELVVALEEVDLAWLSLRGMV